MSEYFLESWNGERLSKHETKGRALFERQL